MEPTVDLEGLVFVLDRTAVIERVRTVVRANLSDTRRVGSFSLLIDPE